MADPFATIVGRLIEPGRVGDLLPAIDVAAWLEPGARAGHPEPSGHPIAERAAAFLVVLAGPDHRLADRALAVLQAPPAGAPADLATLLGSAIEAIRQEVGQRQALDPAFAQTLASAATALADPHTDEQAVTEAIWSVLFPEAAGVLAEVDGSIGALRRRRLVQVDELNPAPIRDAAAEVLFTSNVLLGLPLAGLVGKDAALDPAMAAALARARAAPQRYWFDHPIPIGVEPAANELLHGLRGLDQAMAAEPASPGRPDEPRVRRLTCLLSVSVTHPELRDIARRYVEVELGRIELLRHVDVVVAGEDEVRRLVDEVLVPARDRFVPVPTDASPQPSFDVLGVDGEYGRHYSFLKAIAAIWQVVVDPAVRATFKIDLDQVFPQAELLAETGATALEHLQTPLWGARGRDSIGRPIELGMIAGSLVNAGDIESGLFTPDVPLPGRPSRPSDRVFFSPLPQAISTRAEMLERYDGPQPDGIRTALERVHVTGGTNGILVGALRAHRPFTPSFIGRAEDQAYVLSVQAQDGPRLGYAHAAGLVMRHDKEAYARAAIDAARVGKLVGDDVRILVFSAYVREIAEAQPGNGASFGSIKALMDPFSGGFIARLPLTTVLLRFALRVLEAYDSGQPDLGGEYARIGSTRLAETIQFTADRSAFRARLEDERRQWVGLYDTLDGLERALAAGDPAALELRDHGRRLIDGWRVRQ